MDLRVAERAMWIITLCVAAAPTHNTLWVYGYRRGRAGGARGVRSGLNELSFRIATGSSTRFPFLKFFAVRGPPSVCKATNLAVRALRHGEHDGPGLITGITLVRVCTFHRASGNPKLENFA